MSLPESDVERFQLVGGRLHSAVVGDVLDQMGKTHQILPQPIRPVQKGKMLVGRAMPVLIADVFGPQRQAFGRMTDALDQLGSGEVYVASGGSNQCASWGEIMATAARARGAAGAVLNSFHRDTSRLTSMDWPVFSRGAYAQDAAVRSSVTDYRIDIEIGGVLVQPGDLVVGDDDGVCIVPAAIELEVIERALAKTDAESAVREAIRNGMPTTAAFAEYGVL